MEHSDLGFFDSLRICLHLSPADGRLDPAHSQHKDFDLRKTTTHVKKLSSKTKTKFKAAYSVDSVTK